MADGSVFVVRIISPFNHKMALPKQVCAILTAVSVNVPFVTNEWKGVQLGCYANCCYSLK